MDKLLEQITGELLGQVSIESVNPLEPVKVSGVPKPWSVLGTGNYAAVFCRQGAEEFAVKIYAPGRPGIEEEAEVYRRLGHHQAFSECYYAGADFLVLKGWAESPSTIPCNAAFSLPDRLLKTLTTRFNMQGPAGCVRMISMPRM